MAALAVRPGRPVPVKQLLVDVRLYLARVLLRIPAGVAGVVIAIRKDTRNKRKRLSVRRPQFVVRAGRKGSDLAGFAAVEGNYIHLRRAMPGREKCQSLAIWRPAWPIVSSAGGELARLAT